MRILQITPAGPSSRAGNRTTADRWTRLLEKLGHEVTTATDYRHGSYDLLLALHAYKSSAAIQRFDAAHPSAAIVVALTGTDLYRDLPEHAEAQKSVEMADRLVCLHDDAWKSLPERHRDRLHVIYQSVEPIDDVSPRTDIFEVAVVCHLRDVKDPLRTARAAHLLPDDSQIEVTHVGRAMRPRWEQEAREEMARNARFTWLDEKPRDETLGIISRSRALALTSRLEGGANVVGEAIMAGTPVLSSRIEGSTGLLGADYAGYFEPGDTESLAKLLERFEAEEAFRTHLEEACDALRPKFSAAREIDAWRNLLDEL